MTFRLFLAACLLLTLCVTAHAQGGFGGGQGGGGGFGGGGGGFGGGGQGGGFGGDQGPTGDPTEDQRLPMADQDRSDPFWQERSAILTPGDRVEFKFSLKQGESILAGVTSEAFDPALSVTDSNGKELLKNDDRKEGNQAPFLNFKAPTEGEYLLKVLSYRSVAGGKFTIRMRTIFPVDTNFGKVKNIPINVQAKGAWRRFSLRLPVKSGVTYDIGSVIARFENTWQSVSRIQITGPFGIPSEEYRTFRTGYGSVIESKIDGELIFEYSAPLNASIETDFQVVPVTKIATNQKVSLKVEPNRVARLEMPVRKHQVVASTYRTQVDVFCEPKDADKQFGRFDAQAQDGGSARPWFEIQKRQGDKRNITRVYQVDDTIILLVKNTGMQESIEFENSESIPEFTGERPIQGNLEIGDTYVYRLKVPKSELIRYEFRVRGFLMDLRTLNLNGGPAENPVRANDVYYPESAEFLVTVACVGGGGSGSYNITRRTIEPTKVKLREAFRTPSNISGPTHFAVNLEAGKSYEVTIETDITSFGGSVRLEVMDAKGTTYPIQVLTNKNVSLYYFTPIESGIYRIWIWQRGFDRRAVIREYAFSTIDDKKGG
ncbi:hypothetical protein MCEMSE15_02162 [Fimbriimonadaceae bacterium]